MAQKGWNQGFEKKGSFWGNWGYNVSAYSRSDITFVGQDYNFTLYDMKGTDRPTPFSAEMYLNPKNLSIPQWNLRFGYFISDRWSISIGTDHMKYIVPYDQWAAIEGYINIDNTTWNGAYNRQPFLVSDEFLMFEHTDGLNYASVEAEYHGNVYKFNDKHQINFYVGPGIGLLVPRSNVTLMEMPRYDAFHVAGFGLSGKAGIQVNLWKYLMLSAESKNGFISMQDILSTGKNLPDRANQTFWFTEFTWSIGFIVDFSKKQKEVK